MQHARNTVSGLRGEAQSDSVRPVEALVGTSIPFLRLS